MNKQDLIRRARELAALADNATPGPWKVDCTYNEPVIVTDSQHPEDVVGATTEDSAIGGWLDATDADLLLIAAAPEMARLLKQMAEELEALISATSGPA
jgi:hypothetical protein